MNTLPFLLLQEILLQPTHWPGRRELRGWKSHLVFRMWNIKVQIKLHTCCGWKCVIFHGEKGINHMILGWVSRVRVRLSLAVVLGAFMLKIALRLLPDSKGKIPYMRSYWVVQFLHVPKGEGKKCSGSLGMSSFSLGFPRERFFLSSVWLAVRWTQQLCRAVPGWFCFHRSSIREAVAVSKSLHAGASSRSAWGRGTGGLRGGRAA